MTLRSPSPVDRPELALDSISLGLGTLAHFLSPPRLNTRTHRTAPTSYILAPFNLCLSHSLSLSLPRTRENTRADVFCPCAGRSSPNLHTTNSYFNPNSKESRPPRIVRTPQAVGVRRRTADAAIVDDQRRRRIVVVLRGRQGEDRRVEGEAGHVEVGGDVEIRRRVRQAAARLWHSRRGRWQRRRRRRRRGGVDPDVFDDDRERDAPAGSGGGGGGRGDRDGDHAHEGGGGVHYRQRRRRRRLSQRIVRPAERHVRSRGSRRRRQRPRGRRRGRRSRRRRAAMSQGPRGGAVAVRGGVGVEVRVPGSIAGDASF